MRVNADRDRWRAAAVAQVSKPAVAPISKSAGLGKFQRVRRVPRSAGLETRDTADLEVCGTGEERGCARAE